MIHNPFPPSPHQAAVAIGQSLRRHRIAANTTQTALAERSGVSLATLKRIESLGKGSLEDVMLIAWALGLDNSFVGFIPEPAPGSIDEIARSAKRANRLSGRQRASGPRRNTSEQAPP